MSFDGFDDAPIARRRYVLWCLLGATVALVLWAFLGSLDVVVVAEGRIIPESRQHAIQTTELARISEILVREGETVEFGQPLARLDRLASESDRQRLERDSQRLAIELRRLDAELAGGQLEPQAGDPRDLVAEQQASLGASRRALADRIAAEHAAEEQARRERLAAESTREKLQALLPIARRQDLAMSKLAATGAVSRIMADDKRREYLGIVHDLATQADVIAAACAHEQAASTRAAAISSEHRQALMTQRADASERFDAFAAELRKESHRGELMVMRAPVAGVVNDVATYSPGSVVSPGVTLMSVVPENEPLFAEVWVANQDLGRLRVGLPVELKLAPFEFQRYGTLPGRLVTIAPDATWAEGNSWQATQADISRPPGQYRLLIEIGESDAKRDRPGARASVGMLVTAELKLGRRRVIDYVLSPVTKAVREAARER